MSELRTDSLPQMILKVLPVVSVAVVPVLYLLGVPRHLGRLSAFGLDDSLFPLSFEKALLLGFSFLMGPMFIVIGLPIVLWFFAVRLPPGVKHWRSIVLDKLPKRRATNAPSEAKNYSKNKSETISMYSICVLTVLSFLLIVSFVAYVAARKAADGQISSWKDKKGNVTLYSDLFPGGKDVRQIICGPSHCAFWLGSETLVLRHESIDRMVIHNPAVEGTLSGKAAQPPSP